MIPGPDDEDIENAGILLFNMLICPKGTVKVLIVVPTADGHRRTGDVLELGEDIAILPKLVVIGMLHHFIPKPDANAEILLVFVRDLLEAAGVQKVIVRVHRTRSVPILEVLKVKIRRRAILSETRKKAEILGQKEGSVVVHVVAHIPIRDRSLR